MTQPRTRREMEIWAACDGLWAQAGSLSNITGDAIREEVLRLGYKKGSPNEIYRYRKTWMDARQINASEGDAHQAAAGLDPISRAVQMVHEQLKRDSDDVMAALQTEFDERQSRATIEIAELQKRLTFLEEECAGLKVRKETLLKENERLNEQLRTSETNERLAGERLAAFQSLFEIWRTDSAQKHKQMEALFEQVLSEKEAALVLARKESKTLAEKYNDEVNGLKVQLKNLLHERDGLLERQTKTAEKQKSFEKELKEKDEDMRELIRSRAELGFKERALSEQLAKSGAQIAFLENECGRLQGLWREQTHGGTADTPMLRSLQRDLLAVKRLVTAKVKNRPN